MARHQDKVFPASSSFTFKLLYKCLSLSLSLSPSLKDLPVSLPILHLSITRTLVRFLDAKVCQVLFQPLGCLTICPFSDVLFCCRQHQVSCPILPSLRVPASVTLCFCPGQCRSIYWGRTTKLLVYTRTHTHTHTAVRSRAGVERRADRSALRKKEIPRRLSPIPHLLLSLPPSYAPKKGVWGGATAHTVLEPSISG